MYGQQIWRENSKAAAQVLEVIYEDRNQLLVASLSRSILDTNGNTGEVDASLRQTHY
jgi:hypothetical protein